MPLFIVWNAPVVPIRSVEVLLPLRVMRPFGSIARLKHTSSPLPPR